MNTEKIPNRVGIKLNNGERIIKELYKLFKYAFSPPIFFMIEKPWAAIIAPSFPDAAAMPWADVLNLVGNTSPARTKVVAFGPKLLKNWIC